MNYDLIYTDKVRKQLKKLDKPLQERVINTLERCRIRPHNHLLV
jgi:mRNA-degrading endonuclease RelE of RelBE toxin-antitoxin system